MIDQNIPFQVLFFYLILIKLVCMLLSDYKLQEYFKAIENDSINHSQLTDLIKIFRLIIQSYLINFRSNVSNLLIRNGITITDLAYDCIAEAFGRKSDNKFYHLNKFIISLNHKLDQIDSNSLFLAYKSFLIKVSAAQLARLYSQTDPIGAKILRNIKDNVRKSNKFLLYSSNSGLILSVKDYQHNNQQPDFPFDLLTSQFNPGNGNLNSDILLEKLYDCLNSQNDFKKRLALLDVVYLFKSFYKAHYDMNYDLDESILLQGIESSQFELYDIEQLKLRIETFVKEKILLNYFVKGKLNREETEAIYFTIKDIIIDWFSGITTNLSIYDYFVKYMNVEKITYSSNYRTKIEYLVKLTREEISNQLLDDI